MIRENYSKKLGLGNNPSDYLVLSMDFERVLNSRSKKFVSFTLVQIFEHEFKRHEIIRYDSAHDFVHVHRFYKSRPVVEKIDLPISKRTFFELKKDIDENWSSYKKWFIKNKGL